MVMKAAKKGKKRALELEVVPKEQPMVEEEVPATRYHWLDPAKMSSSVCGIVCQ